MVDGARGCPRRERREEPEPLPGVSHAEIGMAPQIGVLLVLPFIGDAGDAGGLQDVGAPPAAVQPADRQPGTARRSVSGRSSSSAETTATVSRRHTLAFQLAANATGTATTAAKTPRTPTPRFLENKPSRAVGISANGKVWSMTPLKKTPVNTRARVSGSRVWLSSMARRATPSMGSDFFTEEYSLCLMKTKILAILSRVGAPGGIRLPVGRRAWCPRQPPATAHGLSTAPTSWPPSAAAGIVDPGGPQDDGVLVAEAALRLLADCQIHDCQPGGQVQRGHA